MQGQFRTRIKEAGLAALVGTFGLLAAGGAAATPYLKLDADCLELRLKDANGVPFQQVHSYEFNGNCKVIQRTHKGTAVLATVPVISEARWDATKYEFEEVFQALAGFSGMATASDSGWSSKKHWSVTTEPMRSRFKCNSDPLVTKAACGMISHSNKTGYDPFSWPAMRESHPLLQGRTTLAEATALSKLAAAKAPPPPPPPPPGGGTTAQKVLETGSGMAVVAAPAASPPRARSLEKLDAPAVAVMPILGPPPVKAEAELLLSQRRASTNGGDLLEQQMRGFGNGWSGGAQLFWRGGAPGAVLDLLVDVAVAGRYTLVVYPTLAPDYGRFRVQVDGVAGDVEVEGYAPAVAAPAPVSVGTFQLQAGARKVSLQIIGKHRQSSEDSWSASIGWSSRRSPRVGASLAPSVAQ